MKFMLGITKKLTLLTQFGLSLVTPVFLCLFICYLLTSRLGAGLWVYIPGFFFGLGGSATFAYKLYLAEVKKGQADRKERAAFNNHE